MPTFNIVKDIAFESSFRVQSIFDRYELKREHLRLSLSGSIDLEQRDWSVGAIVGMSGTGKSTIAQDIFGDNYIRRFEYGPAAIVDEMPKTKTLDEISASFVAVGLGTVWSWLKPYHVLSTGEQMRCDLARAVLEERETIVFDEFTSVVDRNVARICALCCAKYVRKTNRKFVAVACHRDIIEWLAPDWIYDTDEKHFFFAKNSSDQNSLYAFTKRRAQLGASFGIFTI